MTLEICYGCGKKGNKKNKCPRLVHLPWSARYAGRNIWRHVMSMRSSMLGVAGLANSKGPHRKPVNVLLLPPWRLWGRLRGEIMVYAKSVNIRLVGRVNLANLITFVWSMGDFIREYVTMVPMYDTSVLWGVTFRQIVVHLAEHGQGCSTTSQFCSYYIHNASPSLRHYSTHKAWKI